MNVEQSSVLKDALNKILSMLSLSFMDVQNAITQSGQSVMFSKFHMDKETGLGRWEVDTAMYTITCEMDLTLLSSTSQTYSDTSSMSQREQQLDLDGVMLENVASVPDCEHSSD